MWNSSVCRRTMFKIPFFSQTSVRYKFNFMNNMAKMKSNRVELTIFKVFKWMVRSEEIVPKPYDSIDIWGRVGGNPEKNSENTDATDAKRMAKR